MDIEVLEKIMRQNSLVVRAIPAKSIKILETEHADMYPEGHLMHMPGFNREMLVVETEPEHAGQFIVEQQRNTAMRTQFGAKKYYNSLEEVIADWGTKEIMRG